MKKNCAGVIVPVCVLTILFSVPAQGAPKAKADDFAPKILELASAETGIKIDGNVEEQEWKGAELFDLYLAGTNSPLVGTRNPADKTTVFVLRNKDRLLVGAKCYAKAMDAVLTKHTTNDLNIYEDESVEICFGIEENYYRRVQFIVNSAGNYYVNDNYGKIPPLSGVNVKTQKYPDRWEMEVEIPLQDVMVEPDQEAIKFNVTRTTYGKDEKLKERSAWATVKWNDVPHFGILFLAGSDAKHNETITQRLKTNRLLPVKPETAKSAEDLGREQWFNAVGPNLRSSPAFAYVKDDPALPRILLIGDSISIGYTPFVRESLAGKSNVHRIPGNGGETARGLRHLDQWLGDGEWDVIHFNWGIHDLKRIKDGKWDIAGKPVSNPELYEKNLRELVKWLQATDAKLIWASTTQIPEGASGVPANGEIELNAIAEKIMKENNIPIDDLHAQLAKNLAKFQRKKNVHFDSEGCKYLAESVTASILKTLAEKNDEK